MPHTAADTDTATDRTEDGEQLKELVSLCAAMFLGCHKLLPALQVQ